jgi:AraC family transcriptional activator of pyochelin receptor
MGMLIADHEGNWIEPGGVFEPEFMFTKQPMVIERRDKLSFPFGDAELVNILFSNVFIVYGDMCLKSRSIRMRVDHMPDVVEMHFALNGPSAMHNYINDQTHTFNGNQHNILYVPEFDGTGSYAGNTSYRFFEVHFLSDYFLQLARGSCPVLERFAEKVASGQFADLSKQNLPITAAMHQCIQDIMNCHFTGGLKLLFLQSKCVELLTLQAIAFEQAQEASPTTSVLKSDYDKDCIVHAQEYLLQHLHAPPSLTALAAIAGTNEFKLKKGFKEMFNNTVYGYLSDTRLTQARELLLSGMAIKDVADQLGYSSVQHFGTAFRKKFGFPPGKMHY